MNQYFKIAFPFFMAVLGVHAQTNVAKSEISFKPEAIRIDKNYSIQAESGTLMVPESRKKNNDKVIALQVIRLKSTNPKPGPPIIYLAGGPGTSGIQMLQTERLIIFDALRAFGDVIIFDQRGTGVSKPVLTSSKRLDLPLDKTLDSPESIAFYISTMKQRAEQLKDNNIDINSYNTIENAADVNDIRKALNSEKMILWGYSYGSHLALAVIKQYGEFVEKAILSGVNGLNQRYRLPTDINEVFNEIDRLIGQESTLRKDIPTFQNLVKQELNKLDNKPVTAKIEVNNKPIEVTFGRSDVEVLIALNTASISFIAELPQLFYNMSQNNYTGIAIYIYKDLKTRPEGTPMSYSMHYASGVSEERLSLISNTQSQGLLRNAINYPFTSNELRTIWKVDDLGENFRKPFNSDVPILMLSGNLDGRTSISDAREVGKQFTRKTHMIFNNASHDMLTPQVITVMQNFMAGKIQRDTTYTVPNFHFYALNSSKLIQKATAMLFAEGIAGVNKFKEYYRNLVTSPDTYVVSNQILPTVYQLFSMKKAEVAIEALKINQDLFPEENWQILNAFGDAYIELGNKAEAIKYYKRSLELNALNIKAYKIVHGI
jgi:pimeloyl-ACP methyl ester carboxylesterase